MREDMIETGQNDRAVVIGAHYDHLGHGGGHAHLTGALMFTLAFALVEAVAGYYSGSLALLSDAGHMLTDSTALGLAALTAWLARRPPSRRHTYGLVRLEIVAALVNALLMFGLVGFIAVEAVERFAQPRAVQGGIVTVVAIVGLLVNLGVAWQLSRGEKTLNTRAALLHVMGDLLGSVAALAAGLVIYFTGWMPIDPILSLVVSGLILVSAWRLLAEALDVLLEAVRRARSECVVDLRLVIAGDGPLRSSLQELASRLDLGRVVTWLGAPRVIGGSPSTAAAPSTAPRRTAAAR